MATEIETSDGGEGPGIADIPELCYEYAVDWVSYASSRSTFGNGEPSYSTRSKAGSWLDDDFPVDAEVTVHYDPDQPATSVLKPGVRHSVMTPVFGLAWLFGSVIFLLSG